MLKSKSKDFAFVCLFTISALLFAATSKAGTAYSPDDTFMYVYSPCAFDPADFPDAEYEAVGNYIKDQDYDITTCIYRDTTSNDDDPGTCTLQKFKDCKYAGFLYVSTHGYSGAAIGGIYLNNPGAVDAWRGSEPHIRTVKSSTYGSLGLGFLHINFFFIGPARNLFLNCSTSPQLDGTIVITRP